MLEHSPYSSSSCKISHGQTVISWAASWEGEAGIYHLVFCN